MGDQFTGAGDPTGAPQGGVILKPFCLYGEQFIQRQRGTGVVLGNVFANAASVMLGRARPG